MLFLFFSRKMSRCFYSPSKSRMAAIRATRRKAVLFMLLEECCVLSHKLGTLRYIGHCSRVFCFFMRLVELFKI